MSCPDKCPRCGGTEFIDMDMGADTQDSPAWTDQRCAKCGLQHDGYFHQVTERWFDPETDEDFPLPK